MSTMEEYIYFESKIQTSKSMMQLIVQTNKGTDWSLEEKWYADCYDMIQEITLKKDDYFKKSFFVELEVFPVPHDDEDKLIKMIKGYSSNMKFKITGNEYEMFKCDPRRFQPDNFNNSQYPVYGYKITLSPIMELVKFAPDRRYKKKRSKSAFIGGLTKISEDISELLSTDSKQDIVVYCSGLKIKAHRSILSVRSLWFKANFFGLQYEESEVRQYLEAEGIDSSKFLKEGFDKMEKYLSTLQNRMPNHVRRDPDPATERDRKKQLKKMRKRQRRERKKTERRSQKRGHTEMQGTSDNSRSKRVAVDNSKTKEGSITEENELNVINIGKVGNHACDFPLESDVSETNTKVKKSGEITFSKTAADEIECKNTADDLGEIDGFESRGTNVQNNLVMEVIPDIARSVISSPRLIKNIASSDDGYFVEIDENMEYAFKEFINFLYTGMYAIEDIYTALVLYICADMYGVPDLKYKCSSHIKKSISTTTVIGIFYFACLFRVNDIFDRCKEFLSDEEIKPIIKRECIKELNQIFDEFPEGKLDLVGYEIPVADESSSAQINENAKDSQVLQERNNSVETSNIPNGESRLVGNEIPDGGESSSAQVNENAEDSQVLQEERSDRLQTPNIPNGENHLVGNEIPDGGETSNERNEKVNENDQVSENAEDSQVLKEEGSDSVQTSNIRNGESHLVGNEIPDGGESSSAQVNENAEDSQALQEQGSESVQASNNSNAEAGTNS